MHIAFILVAVLIVYGSIFPFNFTMAGFDDTQMSKFLTTWTLFTTRGDVIGNLILFLPFGIFGAQIRLRRRSPAYHTILIVASGLSLGFGLQMAQLFLPDRSAALSDVVWNVLGALIGAIAGAFGWVRAPAAGSNDFRAWLTVPTLLAGLWIAAQLIPFVPALDWQMFKDSLKPLLLYPTVDAVKVFRHFAAWLAVACLMARIIPVRATTGFPLAVGAVLALQIVIVSNVLTASEVLGAVLAVGAWGLMLRRISRYSLAVGVMLLAAVVLGGLAPFELRAAPVPFGWLPFGSSLAGSMSSNAAIICSKSFLFGASIWLLRDGGVGLRYAIAVAFGVAASVEAAQIFVVGHTPEITDPMLVVIAGLLCRALPEGGPARPLQ